jgi:cbb3-type cytochrome oxidase maturation protein
MSIISVLLPIALMIAIGFLSAFIWCIKSGQYDYLDTDQYRPIIEDDVSQP